MADRIALAGEWDIPPTELAAIFRHKGWRYQMPPGQARAPSADEITRMFVVLFEELHDDSDPPPSMIQRGRFIAAKDPEMPHSITLYLQVGFAWNDAMLSPAEREKLLERGDDDAQP